MSRVIARHRSSLLEFDLCEDENDVESVSPGELVSIIPSYTHKTKSTRLSISRSSAKLRLINLNDNQNKDEHCLPIRRKNATVIENPFQKYKVPSEIIDAIFSNLRKRDLVAAMKVCRKFYEIGNASRRWQITDLMDRPVTELSLVTLMRRKIKVLRLAGAKPDMSVTINSRMFASCLLSSSRLEFLDLSRSNLSQHQLSIVLKPCQKLKCLSIEGNLLNDHVANCISSNKNLRELDISMTNGITVNGAKLIFENCKNLEQFNASWCGLSLPILDVILKNLTNKIQKLNLAGSVRNFGLNDEHIELLSTKAPGLVDIDLSDNTELGDAAVATIISRFPELVSLSLNRCYGMDPNIIVHLNHKPSLVYLNVHGCITEANTELFLQICNRLKINNHLFNFTAKPVSNNSPYIWGHNMRENY
uniref:F-box domain-containing protein n=1 Tax=Caenorhabditis tropicalis TaxID=1561998 RepID=A0A1I7TMR6_9PELO